jgi:hypothetical protein
VKSIKEMTRDDGSGEGWAPVECCRAPLRDRRGGPGCLLHLLPAGGVLYPATTRSRRPREVG